MFRLPALSLRVVASLALVLTAAATEAAIRPQAPRRLVSLDGTWQVAEGDIDRIPTAFDHTVVVPGLIDMARPAFAEVGVKSPRRQAFWYRRTFKVDGPMPEIALVKVNKAQYGMGAWLNGHALGGHFGCFTPGFFDVTGFLRGDGAENTLVVRVGADRESIPAGIPSGWDFEKYRYYPGIYDSVELILTGFPFIQNVQIVPDVATKTVRAVVEIEAGSNDAVATLDATVTGRDARPAGKPDHTMRPLTARRVEKTEVFVSLPDAHLWTPEDPYLYEMTLSTGGDAVKVRFGMRSCGLAAMPCSTASRTTCAARTSASTASSRTSSGATSPGGPSGCAGCTGSSGRSAGTRSATASGSHRKSGTTSPTRRGSSSRTNSRSGHCRTTRRRTPRPSIRVRRRSSRFTSRGCASGGTTRAW
jgi:hypothetical protein